MSRIDPQGWDSDVVKIFEFERTSLSSGVKKRGPFEFENFHDIGIPALGVYSEHHSKNFRLRFTTLSFIKYVSTKETEKQIHMRKIFEICSE